MFAKWPPSDTTPWTLTLEPKFFKLYLSFCTHTTSPDIFVNSKLVQKQYKTSREII